MNVSLNEAKMWATPKTCSPSRVAGPSVTFSSLGSLVFLLDFKIHTERICKNSYTRSKNYQHKVWKTK